MILSKISDDKKSEGKKVVGNKKHHILKFFITLNMISIVK